jgi:hypothetical protein
MGAYLDMLCRRDTDKFVAACRELGQIEARLEYARNGHSTNFRGWDVTAENLARDLRRKATAERAIAELAECEFMYSTPAARILAAGYEEERADLLRSAS